MIEYIDCLSLAEGLNDLTRIILNGKSPLLCIAGQQRNAGDEMYVRGVKKDAARLGIRVTEDYVTDTDGVLLIGDRNFWKDFSLFKDLDVDGVTEYSPYVPAVTDAIREVLGSRMSFAGKTVTVVGRGWVGHSTAKMLLDLNATVAVAHSKTDHDSLAKLFAMSDAVVCAANSGAKFSAGNLADGAILIDVSNSFEFDRINEMEPRRIIATPRKNGVGVVTRAVLLRRVAINCLAKGSGTVC